MKLTVPLLVASALSANSCISRRTGETASGVKSEGSRADVNHEVGKQVVYEVQARAANACDPWVGTDWQKQACASKVSPNIPYRAEGMSCNMVNDLKRLRLGTLGDMMENTNDYRNGITLRYIRESVGASIVWMMPLFPNNDRWNIPDACDDLGSPYAVRDYLHVAGTLSRRCIQQGHDEYSGQPCWANDDLDAFIQVAHAKGIRVMLDIAFNHFGHNYLMYDYQDYRTTREAIDSGMNLDDLWNFNNTYEAYLERPRLMDSAQVLNQRASNSTYHSNILNELKGKCPNLQGDDLVRAFNMWRNALAGERDQFSCEPKFMEAQLPGFYLGSDAQNPSKRLGDNFTNNWRDVKFIYHHEGNMLHRHSYVRNREYLFRVLNYWSSRGVDGFRLDHATEGSNGLSPNFWKYVTQKVNFYAAKRGQPKPFYMAEEFSDQMGMAQVVDFMTEGFVFNLTGRHGETKNTSFIEGAIKNNDRFAGNTYVMTALETHDEPRLTENTGYGRFTGAGFWGAAAVSWSVPMILMGQEFGETYGLGFRRSDYLRARFPGSPTYFDGGDDLRKFYKAMIDGRQRPENRALYASPRHFLRLKDNGGVDERIFAMMKWSEDGNVVFAFHNLWEQDVSAHYFIPPGVASAASMRDDISYKFIDMISGAQAGDCHTGGELKWDLPVIMGKGTRAQWLRLEKC